VLRVERSLHPDAAALMLEGIDRMFTARGLRISHYLAKTLTTTNMIESAISVARDATRNVKRWQDATMIKRWCTAGMLKAEHKFRRVCGHAQMPKLVATLNAHAARVSLICETAQVS